MHVQAYTKLLLARIEAGDIDPSFVLTHPLVWKTLPFDHHGTYA
jgi:hypothetical protein